MTAATSENTPQEKWWVPLLFGILSVILGVFFLAKPGVTSIVAAKFIGIYWIVSGVIQLIHMFQDRTAWGWKLFMGGLSIVAGLFLLFADPISAVLGLGTAFIFVLGFWGIFMGIMLLIGAFKGGGWGAGIMGALAVFLGIILLMSPLSGALALPWVVGIFLIIGGIFSMYQAFKLK
jgi:uncharacterized membrane protein HdeD (DUF308 family)